ncbi:MAG: N-acetylmuramoyl-L-alanine amidase [Methylophaga sp.]|nr:N-acetylmuramoyl-L-alanine amidase [Methylophaga sp.]
MRRLLFGLVLLLVVAPISAATVEGIRMSQGDDTTRLVLDMSGQVEYNAFLLANPDRLVIDISNAKQNANLAIPALDQTPVRTIRQGTPQQSTLRLVLDLHQSVRFETRRLPPHQDHPHRLVIDLFTDQGPGGTAVTTVASKSSTSTTSTSSQASEPSNTQASPQTAEAPSRDEPAAQAPQITPVATPPRTRHSLPRRDIVIAIDPGHGGRDPGAIGPGGTREKDVVLQISRRLARLVDAEPGMRAFMTRDTDTFITLRQRIQRARAAGADMFISVHADAIANNRNARGSSVYILSERGASSEAARLLADRENAADLHGGISLENKDDLLASVLLDLSQTASLEASVEVANNVLSGLKRLGHVHKRQVESANFVVLRSPDIPSILVETAFISNPEEERRLRDPDYQERLAQSMMSGIRTYFQRNPITETVKPQQHVVSRGDTLSGIAQRYRVNMAELKSTNNLQSNTLRVGDVLRIP